MFATFITVCRHLFNLLLYFTLTSTASAGDIYLSLSTGSPLFGYQLLTKAAQGIPTGDISDNASVLAGRSLRFGVSYDQAIAENRGWASNFSVGLFEITVPKPGGIGIFIDPAMIHSKAVFIEAEAGYWRNISINHRPLFTATASLGAQLSYSTISARSAVLNIRENLFAIEPYVQIKLDRGYAPTTRANPWVSIRYSTNNYRELTAGISFKF